MEHQRIILLQESSLISPYFYILHWIGAFLLQKLADSKPSFHSFLQKLYVTMFPCNECAKIIIQVCCLCCKIDHTLPFIMHNTVFLCYFLLLCPFTSTFKILIDSIAGTSNGQWCGNWIFNCRISVINIQLFTN